MARKPLKVVRSAVHFAPLKAVDKYLETAPEEALECRDGGHLWGKPLDIEGDSKRGYIRYFKCRSCEALRDQYLDEHGLVIRNVLRYPEGYLMPAGSGRLSREGRGAIRLATTLSEIQRLRPPKKRASRKQAS
jgi:hypothetical protein